MHEENVANAEQLIRIGNKKGEREKSIQSDNVIECEAKRGLKNSSGKD